MLHLGNVQQTTMDTVMYIQRWTNAGKIFACPYMVYIYTYQYNIYIYIIYIYIYWDWLRSMIAPRVWKMDLFFGGYGNGHDTRCRDLQARELRTYPSYYMLKEPGSKGSKGFTLGHKKCNLLASSPWHHSCAIMSFSVFLMCFFGLSVDTFWHPHSFQEICYSCVRIILFQNVTSTLLLLLHAPPHCVCSIWRFPKWGHP